MEKINEEYASAIQKKIVSKTFPEKGRVLAFRDPPGFCYSMFPYLDPEV